MASSAALGAAAVLLLCGSNAFMTTAWYLHLKFKSWSLVKAIFISWAIAFGEYCLQVPANRLGHYSQGGPFTAPQLKIIQEFISLTAFAIFSVTVLKEKLRWVDLGAFILICSGVALGMVGKPPDQHALPPPPPELEAPAPAPDPGGRRLLLMKPWLAIKGGRPSSSNHSAISGAEMQENPPPDSAGLPSGALHATHTPGLGGTQKGQAPVAGDSQRDLHPATSQRDVETGSDNDSASDKGSTSGKDSASGKHSAGEEAPVTHGAAEGEGSGPVGAAAQDVDVRIEG